MTRISPDVADFVKARIHDFKEQHELLFEERFVCKTGDSMLGPLTVLDPKNQWDATNKRFVESLLTKNPKSFSCSSLESEKRTFFSPRFNIPFDASIISIVFDTFPVKLNKSGEDVLNFMIKGEVQKLELKKKSNEHSVKFDFKEPIRVEKNTSHTFFSDSKLRGSLTIWYTVSQTPQEELN